MKKLIVALAFFVAAVASQKVLADVPLDCSDNCGPVQIPNNGQPPASQAGSAPGHPIEVEAPSTPVQDPVAPVEPPSPGH